MNEEEEENMKTTIIVLAGELVKMGVEAIWERLRGENRENREESGPAAVNTEQETEDEEP